MSTEAPAMPRLPAGNGWGLLFWTVFAHSLNALALLDEERTILAVNRPRSRSWGSIATS